MRRQSRRGLTLTVERVSGKTAEKNVWISVVGGNSTIQTVTEESFTAHKILFEKLSQEW